MKKSDELIIKKILAYCQEIEISVTNTNYDDFMLPEKFERRKE